MHYDNENDKFVSRDGSMEIFPLGPHFVTANTISIEVGSDAIIISISQIEELIEGLRMANRKVSANSNV